MCCWPCILVMIKFRFQLNARYFIPIVMLLYMFRALLRPSLGGLPYIYNIWFYVSTQPKDKTRKIRTESRFFVSCPWVVYWHRTRCCKYAEVLLRMGARMPKHVEELNYWNKMLCIKLEPEFNHYQDARSTTHKEYIFCCTALTLFPSL
jgi:hypothetical protein